MKRQYTDPMAGLERMGIVDRDYVVFTDLDKTIRWDNQPVPRENRLALKRFRENGGLVIPVTGSPVRYIPPFLRRPVALAEFGAILCTNTRYWVLASPKEQEALKSLHLFLGLYVEDGVQEVVGFGEVAIGGPRYASLNLNIGNHPAYVKMRCPAIGHRLTAEIQNYIKYQPLDVTETDFGEYKSIDLTTHYNKRAAVQWLLGVLKSKRSYYLGDGPTDLAAMLLPGITAVGFQNSCDGIKSVAQMYVDKPGPDGGAAEAFEIIQKREQAMLA